MKDQAQIVVAFGQGRVVAQCFEVIARRQIVLAPALEQRAQPLIPQAIGRVDEDGLAIVLNGQFETPKAAVSRGEIGVGLGLVWVLAQRVLVRLELGVLFVQDAGALEDALPLCGATEAQQSLPDPQKRGRLVGTKAGDLAQLALGLLVIAQL